MKNIKAKKEYPENLLSQVFVNGLPTELPDDVALVLEYIIQKTLTEREGRVLDLRYKRYMTMAAIGEEYGLRAERIRQIEAKQRLYASYVTQAGANISLWVWRAISTI